MNEPISKQKGHGKKITVSKFELTWNSRYLQLEQFRRRFGHCDVPQLWKENIQLGRWVIRQRVRKRFLTTKRIDKLNKIGFSWNVFDLRWQKMFLDLVKYKKKHGHCDVSRGEKRFLRLAEWVSKQRRDRKKRYDRLDTHKVRDLDSIGFRWSFYDKPGWDRQYENLCKFRQEYGHTRVRQGKRISTLGSWVSVQRRDKHKLTRDQIAKLDGIGFMWSIWKREKV